jgi:hypothetical protein
MPPETRTISVDPATSTKYSYIPSTMTTALQTATPEEYERLFPEPFKLYNGQRKSA